MASEKPGNNIELNVLTDLERRALRRTAKDLKQTFDRTGVDIARDYERNVIDTVSKGNRSVADDLARQRKDDLAAIRVLTRTEQDRVKDRLDGLRDIEAKRQRDHNAELRRIEAERRARIRFQQQQIRFAQQQADRAERLRVKRDRDRLGRNGAGAVGGLAGLGRDLSGLGRAVGPAGIAALVPLATGLTGALSTLSGVIGVFPGVTAAAGAGIGSLALGLSGFGDAIEDIRDPEKFAEAIKRLSPAAQAAAMSVRNLVPEFDRLRLSTQQALFAGVGPLISELANTLLPTIQATTTGIANALNNMFGQFAMQLQTPKTLAALDEIGHNLVATFDALGPAVAPFTDAIVEIARVSTGFLPQLAQGLANAAQEFGQWINDISASGELEQWISRGITAVGQLWDITKDLASTFLALAPVGEKIMPMIVDAADTLANVMPTIANVVSDISPFFTIWGPVMEKVANATERTAPAMESIANAVATIASLSPQLRALEALGNLLPGGGSDPRGGRSIPKTPGAPGVGGALGQSSIDRPPLGLPPGFTMPPSFSSSSAGDAVAKEMTRAPFVDPSRFAASSPLSSDPDVARALRALEEARLREINLKAVGNADQLELLRARNSVLDAEQRVRDAEQRAIEEHISAMEKSLPKLRTLADSLGQVGAALDRDLGFSKGLPGLADNLVRFLASLAFAPAVGALSAAQVNAGYKPGSAGSGIFGMLAGTGALGAAHMVTPSAMGPTPLGGNVGSPIGPVDFSSVGMPSILNDTGSVASGPQSRMAAALIQKFWGDQIRGKIGGSRDNNTAKGTHDAGLSIDIPIGPDQMAVGDEINSFLQANAGPLGLKYTIWRNQGKYPGGGGFPAKGHMNHIDAHFNGQPGTGPMSMSAAFSSGATPVFVTNWPGGAGGFGGPAFTPSGQGTSGANWDAIAGAESSGDWAANTGNGFFGGLQFKQSTWDAFKPHGAPARADLATKAQQIAAAENVLRGQGPKAWPATFQAHPEWFTGGGGSTLPGAGMPTGLPSPALGQPGGPTTPGLGVPSFATGQGTGPLPGPPPVQGHTPGQGGWQTSGGGFAGLGGLPMGAIQGAISAAGTAGAPFGGQAAAAAAQMVVQLLNRTAAFAGQSAGILAQGAIDTITPGGSQMADLSNNLLMRIAGGFAGSRPSIPVSAGQQEAPMPNSHGGDPAQSQAQPQSPQGQQGNTFNQSFVFPNASTDEQVARDVKRQTNAYGAGQPR
ncbi:transglycosylase family protein [Mycolicibacterium sp. XJ662]